MINEPMPDDLKSALEAWEGFDPYLTYEENLIEMQIDMGFLDEAKKVIYNIKD